MISAIKQFFEDNLSAAPGAGETEQADGERRIQLASAALLIELMKTDMHIDARETETLTAVLQSTFELDRATLDELVRLAEAENENATSLYEFTSLVNAGYDEAQKIKLIKNMWKVAFADGELDKYEEHLIRRIADLIYVTHSDFIRTKIQVRGQE